MHTTDAHLGENQLFVGLRRLLSELKNSHALRAQTMVLRSDAMRAHSRIFKQMLILSCAPAVSFLIGNKNVEQTNKQFSCRRGIVLKYGIFM